MHYTATLCNEKCKQAAAGDVGGHKAQTLNPEGPEPALITLNENSQAPIKLLLHTTPVTTELKALDQLTSAEENQNKSVSASFPSPCNTVKASTEKPTPVGHPNP